MPIVKQRSNRNRRFLYSETKMQSEIVLVIASDSGIAEALQQQLQSTFSIEGVLSVSTVAIQVNQQIYAVEPRVLEISYQSLKLLHKSKEDICSITGGEISKFSIFTLFVRPGFLFVYNSRLPESFDILSDAIQTIIDIRGHDRFAFIVCDVTKPETYRLVPMIAGLHLCQRFLCDFCCVDLNLSDDDATTAHLSSSDYKDKVSSLRTNTVNSRESKAEVIETKQAKSSQNAISSDGFESASERSAVSDAILSQLTQSLVAVTTEEDTKNTNSNKNAKLVNALQALSAMDLPAAVSVTEVFTKLIAKAVALRNIEQTIQQRLQFPHLFSPKKAVSISADEISTENKSDNSSALTSPSNNGSNNEQRPLKGILKQRKTAQSNASANTSPMSSQSTTAADTETEEDEGDLHDENDDDLKLVSLQQQQQQSVLSSEDSLSSDSELDAMFRHRKPSLLQQQHLPNQPVQQQAQPIMTAEEKAAYKQKKRALKTQRYKTNSLLYLLLTVALVWLLVLFRQGNTPTGSRAESSAGYFFQRF